jgi:dolichol-phosphate mannosyltransferase
LRLKEFLVIIPSYNEIENIDAILTAVLSLPVACDVLVVDDGSPDGTAARVKSMMPDSSGRLHLLERKKKEGLGRAYIAGFQWALQRSYQCIAEMDADFSHPPEKLEALFHACFEGRADVAIGSRYVPGGSVLNWPKSRLLLSRAASLYVRLITGMPVMDPTAGFVCYSRKVLEAIGPDQVHFTGYAFQIEMKYSAYRLGFRLLEIPIQFPDRVRGQSKMNIFIIREALTGVVRLKWRSKQRRKPL